MAEPIAASPSRSDQPTCRVLACSGSLDGGGSERQLWQLVSRLDLQRFSPEVYLLARRGVYLDQLPVDTPVHAFADQYPKPSRFPPGRISWLQTKHLHSIVTSRQIDVVYDRTYHMSLVTGSLPREIPRVSVIVSPPSQDIAQSERRFRWLKRRLLARAYASADRTICVSHEVALDASNYYRLPLERFMVLTNPVDTTLVMQRAMEPVPDSARLLARPKGDQLHVAIVGRFTPEKGHAFALRVAGAWQANDSPRMPPVQLHLHFIGSGPLESELRKQADQLPHPDWVHFHGYQLNPYPIMRACDVVLVPSRYEGFPNVALEAMALGVPLIMTNYGATAAQLAGQDQERCSLIALDDIDQAMHALDASIRQAHSWRERAKAAQGWVNQQHALPAWLETMSQLLLDVAQRRPR